MNVRRDDLGVDTFYLQAAEHGPVCAQGQVHNARNLQLRVARVLLLLVHRHLTAEPVALDWCQRRHGAGPRHRCVPLAVVGRWQRSRCDDLRCSTTIICGADRIEVARRILVDLAVLQEALPAAEGEALATLVVRAHLLAEVEIASHSKQLVTLAVRNPVGAKWQPRRAGPCCSRSSLLQASRNHRAPERRCGSLDRRRRSNAAAGAEQQRHCEGSQGSGRHDA
mmetsp:Transcript_9539/g.25859  ORF Transcript_9539/g.25859 Transcript_9539/m.25859 type:complete len:224 (-) Transcript_9539:42-713(-)